MPDQNSMADLVLEHYHLEGPRARVDPIEMQRYLQSLVEQTKPGRLVQTGPALTYGELLKRVRFNREAIEDEFAEIMDMLPWKEWKTYKARGEGDPISEDDRIELAYELVDILHFLFNLFIALGVDWQLMLNIYLTKNLENQRRQREGY